MKRKPIIAGGYVKDGRIVLDQRVLVRAALKAWSGRIRLTIEPEEQNRRQRANRYYFGVVLKLMAEECGHSAEDLHELMKLRHNSKTAVDPNGEEVTIPKTTTKLTIPEFSYYLEAVNARWGGVVRD